LPQKSKEEGTGKQSVMGKYMIYEMARRQGEKLTLESIMSETLENLLLGQDFGVIETEKTPVNTPVKIYCYSDEGAGCRDYSHKDTGTGCDDACKYAG